jgi:hypothetical protein
VLKSVVSIYGSRDLFVNEYRVILADRCVTSYQVEEANHVFCLFVRWRVFICVYSARIRLLSNLSYATDQEVRTLELLKLRFGEEVRISVSFIMRTVCEFHKCEFASSTCTSSHRNFSRFSTEQVLHACEIMLRDVEDSKRINANIHADMVSWKQLNAVNALLVTRIH